MFLEHLLRARFIRGGGQALYTFPSNLPDNPVTAIVYLNKQTPRSKSGLLKRTLLGLSALKPDPFVR